MIVYYSGSRSSNVSPETMETDVPLGIMLTYSDFCDVECKTDRSKRKGGWIEGNKRYKVIQQRHIRANTGKKNA